MIERVLTLTAPADAEFSPYSPLQRDGPGNLYVGISHSATGLLVFDPGGRLVRRVEIASPSPEDRRLIALALGAGDSVYVADASLNRLHVVSPQGRLTRTSAVGGLVVYGVVPYARGSILLQGVRNSPDLAGLSAHMLGPGGRLTRSFGEVSPTFHAGRLPYVRPVADAGGGRFWMAVPGRFAVELWDTLGHRLSTVAPARPWFAPWDRMDGRSAAEAPPQPAIVSLASAGPGRLWVVSRVADRNWRPSRSAGARNSEEAASPRDAARQVDTVIELLDTRTGRAVASARLDEAPPRMLQSGYAYRYAVNGQGRAVLEILRVSTR